LAERDITSDLRHEEIDRFAVKLALNCETLTGGKVVKNRRILSGDIELVLWFWWKKLSHIAL